MSAKRYRRLFIFSLVLLAVLLPVLAFINHGRKKEFSNAGIKSVAVTNTPDGYRLYRNGQAYFIKGADINDYRYLSAVKKAGANSVHIYTTDRAQDILDSAQSLGLTVTVNLYMGLAGKDIDYGDEKQVKEQLEKLRTEVLKYKDHPALLMWGVGNETNLFLKEGLADLPAHLRVNKAINAVARMIHEVDPNHPTVMMVTGGSRNRISSFICDQVDIIGYNSFETFSDQIKKSYWNGPYIVSEFGQPAYWISPQTAWYKYLEPSSREKMIFMEQQYKSFTADKNCLGSYAFYWDYKQEYTATWFSLYTKKGEPTELTEKLHSLWTERPLVPINQLQEVFVNGYSQTADIYLVREKQYPVRVMTTLPITDSTEFSWEIQTDSHQEFNLHFGMETPQATVDSGTMLPTHAPALSRELNFQIKGPITKGPYRLFLYLKDKSGTTSTANTCFYVHD
jgi:hypothetical protein